MRTFLRHPSPEALARFADGEATPSERRSVAAHLEGCGSCRALIAANRTLRATARALDVPKAPPSLLQRVLAERAAGERVILPVGERTVRRPSRMLRAASVLLVVGTAGVLVARSVFQPTSRTAGPSAAAVAPADDSVSSLHELFVSAGFLPSVAFAAEAVSRPEVPPVAGVDGTKLRPVQLTYQSRWVDSLGRITVDGDSHVNLVADSYQGTPAWRVENSAAMHSPDNGQLRLEAETLWVRRDDLRPLARTVTVAPYRRYRQIIVQQQFRHDSVVGDMEADGGVHRTFNRPLPRNFAPYTTDALAPLLLGAVSLQAGWRGSISIVGWGVVPSDVLFPSSLAVVGEERLTTAAGVVACWKLRIATAAGGRSYWVRKSDGVGIKVRVDGEPRNTNTNGVREVVLTSR